MITATLHDAQACGARGLLPGQRSSTIRFARAPKSLDPDGEKPLGQCRGWVPRRKPAGGIYGYATDDIFYLEVRGLARELTHDHCAA